VSNGERRKVEQGNPPVILMFQPTEYEIVTGDRLQEWEEDLAESVGLRGLGDLDPSTFRTGTYAQCGGGGWDYCDQLPL
jgi:hypothetical protein